MELTVMASCVASLGPSAPARVWPEPVRGCQNAVVTLLLATPAIGYLPTLAESSR
ncbi:hypothetical protein ACIBL5_14355 [Streptomyces sp. NPDC050516]|uniref:hypothetical protein n=1 Tax=Streptomyces sp. NPDC050516 TaxID=3365621 RepID=UPI0037B5B279